VARSHFSRPTTLPSQHWQSASGSASGFAAAHSTSEETQRPLNGGKVCEFEGTDETPQEAGQSNNDEVPLAGTASGSVSADRVSQDQERTLAVTPANHSRTSQRR
jgi:hypothetical protein